MHEIFKIKSSNPSQKFCKNLFDFENPKNFQKSQKLRLKSMKCMKMRDLDTYQVKETWLGLKNSLRNRFKVRERGFGRWKG